MKSLSQSSSLSGYLCAVAAFSFWGFIPLYWREISYHSPWELIGHRILWGSLVLLFYLLFWKRRDLPSLVRIPFQKKNSWLFLSALLIATNWFTFMYAVSIDKVVEASLGYFLNPLINVFLGLILFKESVSRLKWVSILLAFTGLILFSMGKLSSPGISLLLASTFALYGVLHKKSSIPPLQGLFVETLIVSVFLLPYLFLKGDFSLSSLYHRDFLWLFAAGPVTVVPLILFSFAVKRIPYSSVGIIQYLAPLGQFALGVSVFNQKLETQSLVAFCLIWLALSLFSFGEYNMLRQTRKAKLKV